MATVNLLPLIVLERAGPTANAYFYLSWTIAYSLYLVSRNMGMSLIAEASADQRRLDVLSFRMFAQTVRMLTPMVLAIVLGAPLILLLFGDSYAAEGTTLLRLLTLSALPYLIVSLYLSILRIQRGIGALVLVLTSLCVLVLALSYFLLDLYGIVGIGLAWLIGQTVVAVVLLLTELRMLWLPHLNTQAILCLFTIPRRAWRRWGHRRQLATVRSQLPDILSAVSRSGAGVAPVARCAHEIIPTVGDVVVVSLGGPGQAPTHMLKLPQTGNAVQSLQRQGTVIETLRADPKLADLHPLLPTVLAAGQVSGQPFVVERILPGVVAEELLAHSTSRTRMLTAAAAVIGTLHCQTACRTVVDEGMLKRWVGDPLKLLRRAFPGRNGRTERVQAVDRLSASLHNALCGRTMGVGWVHGDFAPRNILVTPDGSEVTGLIDWDQASPLGLPQLDLVHLILSTRMAVHHLEMGDVICGLLDGAKWTGHEQTLLAAAGSVLPGEPLAMRELVLLSWLQHIAANLTKSTRYAGHTLWRIKNVENVLRCI
jgi:hypothetical protein